MRYQFFFEFGFKEKNIEKVREQIEEMLNFKFIGRDSSYIGEYYSAHLLNDEYILRNNFNVLENEYDFPKFSQYPVILEAVVEDNNLVINKMEIMSAKLLSEMKYSLE